MNDRPMNDFPEMDDPVLDRELKALSNFEPSAGFADVVMSRVRRPAPGWYRSGARAVGSLGRTRRRAWALAGGLGASWAVATAAAVVLVLQNNTAISSAWSGLNGGALTSLWKSAITGVADWLIDSAAASEIYLAINFLTQHPGLVVGSVVLMGVISLISMWGLLRILAQTGGGRIPVHAIH